MINPVTTRYHSVKINGKRKSLHRHIVEQHLGRKLTRDEVVHHKNGIKTDNRLENLEVLTHKEHAMHHLQKHPITKTCEVCGTIFKPSPTKRARKRSCSKKCRYELIARKQRKPLQAQVAFKRLCEIK